MKKTIALLILGVVAAGCVSVSGSRSVHSIYGKVISVTIPAFESGAIATFVAIEVEDRSNTVLQIYVPYMAQGQSLPKVGGSCVFEVREQNLVGLAGATNLAPAVRRLVIDFSCES